jgi:AmmeMemoRadiSam system protein B
MRNTVRAPAVAGSFYPAAPEELRQAIASAFRSPRGPDAVPEYESGGGRLVGVMAPHAGYVYSGAAAAWGYAAMARAGRPHAVVILGVNHRGIGASIALSAAAGWETPLGISPVDRELGHQLLQLDADVQIDARAHALEHSLEVHIPFIQSVFHDVPIVPIAISAASFPAVQRLGEALAVLARERTIVLLASSDLSHFQPQEVAVRQDHQAMACVQAIDPTGLWSTVREQGITMCGVLPVASMLTAARALGANRTSLLQYYTSGDVSGDTRQVVGYGTIAVYRAEDQEGRDG